MQDAVAVEVLHLALVVHTRARRSRSAPFLWFRVQLSCPAVCAAMRLLRCCLARRGRGRHPSSRLRPRRADRQSETRAGHRAAQQHGAATAACEAAASSVACAAASDVPKVSGAPWLACERRSASTRSDAAPSLRCRLDEPSARRRRRRAPLEVPSPRSRLRRQANMHHRALLPPTPAPMQMQGSSPAAVPLVPSADAPVGAE